MTPLPKQSLSVLAVLMAFVAATLFYFMVHEQVDGDDLASSYLGCRVIAAGEAKHLYAHDPKNFAAIGPDDPWQHAADVSGYVAFMHPYVQTPLWGYSLLPVCRHTNWAQFEWLFATLALLSFAGLIYLVARYWAPAFLHPLLLAIACALLGFSVPFQYSMDLMQTHIFFVLAMVAALILADRQKAIGAGFLLAFAAAVKITPGVLVVYWLVRRQWKAAASAAAWTVLLWVVTRVVAGPQLMATYSATIDRISHTLLLSANNQSFAAFWMDPLSRAARRNSFDVAALPSFLRLTCSGLLALTAAAGGWLDWRASTRNVHAPTDRSIPVPIGGLLTMVGATTFAPVEWLHYSIVLIAPLMVLVQYARAERFRWIWIAVVAILALNLPPLAADQFEHPLSTSALLRGHFYSEVVCLVVLLALAFRAVRPNTRQHC